MALIADDGLACTRAPVAKVRCRSVMVQLYYTCTTSNAYGGDGLH
jgi:hypothetical protein